MEGVWQQFFCFSAGSLSANHRPPVPLRVDRLAPKVMAAAFRGNSPGGDGSPGG